MMLVTCVSRCSCPLLFFYNATATTEIYTLSLHDALPILRRHAHGPLRERRPVRAGHRARRAGAAGDVPRRRDRPGGDARRSEEHTSELQSRQYLVCRLLLEKTIMYRRR